MFKKGQSGNPSGRPKVPEGVKELARAYTQDAILTLAKVMKDAAAPHSARVRASESLLDRAWGKAETTSHVTVTKDVRDLSTAEILAALAAQGVIGEEGSAGEDRAVH